VLRELQDQRSQQLGDVLEIVKGKQTIGFAHRSPHQSVQALERTTFVLVDVARRVERHRVPTTPFAVDPQHDLLAQWSRSA
jgi:hypothetical protein